MGVYMKVPGNSLELPDKLSSFVVSPPKGGEMGVYMKVPGDSFGDPISFQYYLLCLPDFFKKDILYKKYTEHA
ncbi:MAG: hypothetical protein D3910_24760 [Candidatus Electrothrix sp. ATG2]|nr:hypothetical protein [Candidatus Electrothrix sp. ATG2]